MTEASPVTELLVRWEELRAAGRSVTAEELCRDRPELLAEVRQKIAVLGAMLRGLETSQPAVTPTDAALMPTTVRRPGDEAAPGYTLVKPLGRGGFGEVWQATAPGGIPVALKFVPWTGSLGEKERRALDLLRNLRHPHLLATTAAWHQGGFLVLALELADGSLADRLEQAKAAGLPGIPADELLRYMTGAAEGLDYLNRPASEGGTGPGVQHRDIKPQNLLCVGGEAKVADFGLARLLTETSTGHTGAMTPAFAPPEFFRSETSRHSDQYSLAVTYCMLRGGRLPFEGSPVAIMAGHVDGKPDLSMLPEAERPPVARALAKRPADRWPSCRTFVNELSGHARPDARLQPLQASRPTWHLRVAASLGIAAFAVFGAWLIHRWALPASPITDQSNSSELKAESSEQAVSKGTAKSPPHPAAAALVEKSIASYGRKDFAQAVADCTEAIRLLAPADPPELGANAYSQRAHAYLALQKTDAAFADAMRAVELKPDRPLGYYYRGRSYYQQGRYQLAIKDFDRAMELKPDSRGNAYHFRSLAKKAIGDSKGAAADQQKANEIWAATKARAVEETDIPPVPPPPPVPAAEQARQQEARRLIQHAKDSYNDDKPQAIADCDKAIRLLTPSDPADLRAQAYAIRAHAYQALHKYSLGLADAEKAVELDPKLALGYYCRGQCYKGLKQLQPALSDLDRAIRMKPDWSVAYYVRGTIRTDMRKWEAAIEDYTQAIRLGPDYADAYRQRSHAKAMVGDQKGADADKKKADELSRGKEK